MTGTVPLPFAQAVHERKKLAACLRGSQLACENALGVTRDAVSGQHDTPTPSCLARIVKISDHAYRLEVADQSNCGSVGCSCQ